MASLKWHNNTKDDPVWVLSNVSWGKRMDICQSLFYLSVYFFSPGQVAKHSCNIKLKDYAFRFCFYIFFFLLVLKYIFNFSIDSLGTEVTLFTSWSPISSPHPYPLQRKQNKVSKQTKAKPKNSANQIKTKPTTKREKSLWVSFIPGSPTPLHLSWWHWKLW